MCQPVFPSPPPQVQYDFLHNVILEGSTVKDHEVSQAEFCQYYWSLLDDDRKLLKHQYEVRIAIKWQEWNVSL